MQSLNQAFFLLLNASENVFAGVLLAANFLAQDAIFLVGVLGFSALIALTFTGYKLGANSVLVFWAAYILTRPLGASLGDLLSQAKLNGSLGFGAMLTSAAFLLTIVCLVFVAHRQLRDQTAIA